MSDSTREIRSALFRELRATKAEDGTRKIGGYAAVYDALSTDLGGFVEQIQRGAFASALKPNADVLCLRDHDCSLLLGRTTAHTLTLADDDKGLSFECILPDSDYADALYASITRGDIDACSFCFTCNKDMWDQTGEQVVRTLIDVTLLEVSVVSFPAYPQTSVSTRSASDEIRSLIDSRAKKVKTKTVDGEHLTADDFLIVLDPEKTDTWHLPWHFSTDEKTESHLRDALARFSQLKDIPQDALDKAWEQLLKLCKEHDIDVSDADTDNHRASDLILAALIAARLR